MSVRSDTRLSVILPVHDEEECIVSTIRELDDVLAGMDCPYEILAVDDGSRDTTPVLLEALKARVTGLRVFRLTPNVGQSAAFGVGLRHARGRIIVTMDADGQNDPADIPRLIAELADCDACCGYRQKRQDPVSKRIGSVLANRVRNSLLGEDVIDTGCSLKAFRSDIIQGITLWKGLHRFLPSLLLMRGARLKQIPVNHRSRLSGRSKYTNWQRMKEAIWDLLAVRWMQRRNPKFEEEER